MLGPGGGIEQQFGPFVHVPVGDIEQRASDLIGYRAAARLAGRDRDSAVFLF